MQFYVVVDYSKLTASSPAQREAEIEKLEPAGSVTAFLRYAGFAHHSHKHRNGVVADASAGSLDFYVTT